eukprot:scaffold2714_cov413-Prasinococcus_capsulatus_cf.AAC.5
MGTVLSMPARGCERDVATIEGRLQGGRAGHRAADKPCIWIVEALHLDRPELRGFDVTQRPSIQMAAVR